MYRTNPNKCPFLSCFLRNTPPQTHTLLSVFRSFLSNDIKQDAATNIAHSKQITELLKQRNIMSDN